MASNRASLASARVSAPWSARHGCHSGCSGELPGPPWMLPGRRPSPMLRVMSYSLRSARAAIAAWWAHRQGLPGPSQEPLRQQPERVTLCGGVKTCTIRGWIAFPPCPPADVQDLVPMPAAGDGKRRARGSAGRSSWAARHPGGYQRLVVSMEEAAKEAQGTFALAKCCVQWTQAGIREEQAALHTPAGGGSAVCEQLPGAGRKAARCARELTRRQSSPCGPAGTAASGGVEQLAWVTTPGQQQQGLLGLVQGCSLACCV